MIRPWDRLALANSRVAIASGCSLGVSEQFEGARARMVQVVSWIRRRQMALVDNSSGHASTP